MENAITLPGIHMGMDRVIAKKRPPLAWIIGGAFALLLMVMFLYQLLVVDTTPIQTARRSEIKISAARKGDFQEYFIVNGYVAPAKSIFIDAQEYGIVQSVYADQGSIVKRGELLALLRNEELESQLSAKEAELRDLTQELSGCGIVLDQVESRGRALVFELDHQIEVARDEYESDKALFDASAVTRNDLRKAERELEYLIGKRAMLLSSNELDIALRKQEEEKLRNSIEILRIDLRRLQGRIAALTVVSPAYGQITSFNASVGEVKVVGARIAQLDSMDTLKLKADIDEYYLPKIAIGNRGSFTVMDVKGEELPCGVSVSWISPDVKGTTFEADFKFDSAPANLRIGQRFLLRIELGKKREAVVLEQGPFFQATGGRWVYLVDASGSRATRKDIVVGRSNPDCLEVTSGLEPGDRVVVSDYSGFNGLSKISLR
jgi:HlyD family secretion protein